MSDRIEYTDAEKAAMREALSQFDGYSAPPEHIDRIRRSICSRALSQLAVETMSEASPSNANRDASQNARMHIALADATGSLQKAYAVFPFPFYLYDLAGLREIAGASDEALALYEQFVSELNALRPDAVDRGLLKERDVESDTREARERIATIRRKLHLAPRPWWKVW
jgi:hypothetical protein